MGLAVVLLASQRGTTAGCQHSITAMSPAIGRRFEIAGIDTLLAECGDV